MNLLYSILYSFIHNFYRKMDLSIFANFVCYPIETDFSIANQILVHTKPDYALKKLGDLFTMQNIIMVVAIIILVALSAFFSSMETAINSCSRARLQNMKEKEVKGSSTAIKFLDEYDKTITTLLIGNNIVNIGASSIATILCTNLLGSYGAAVSTGALTLIILTFGEIIPKCYAKENSEKLATKFSAVVYFLMVILTPLSAFFIKINSLAMRLSGSSEDTPSVTEDELKYIIESIEEEGVLEEAESEMVQSALEFDEKTRT